MKPVFETTRKVQKFGSSLAVTLPAFFVQANEIAKGAGMKVIYDLKKGTLVVFPEDLPPEKVLKALKDMMEKVENG